MSRAVLVGMPGVGKTTVGRLLATRLDCEFLDLDLLLEEAVGVSAAAFIRENGEQAFREAEYTALRVALQTDAVVSCGGGTVTYEPSRELLKKHPCVLWLTAPLDTLANRVAGGDRPLLGTHPAEALASLWEDRRPLYESVASAAVNSDRPPLEVVDELLDYVGKLSS